MSSSNLSLNDLPAGPSCKRCGLTTTAPELLVPDEKKRLYCMPCRVTVFRQRTVRTLLSYAVMFIVLDMVFSNGGHGHIALPGLLFVGGIFVLMSVCTVIHEAGHALAALAMGWQIHAVALGFGRMLARFRVGRTLIMLRSSVFGGFCMTTPPQITNRFLREAFVMVLGGPMANLIMAMGMVLVIWLAHPMKPWVSYPVFMFLFMNLMTGLLNLCPRIFDAFGARMGTDGMQLKWIRTEPDKYRERFEYGQAMAHFYMARLFDEHIRAQEAMAVMERRYPQDPLTMVNRAATEAELGNYEACLNLGEELLRRLENGDTLTNPMLDLNPMYVPALFRAMTYDNMAWALLMLKRNVPEALELAGYAYAITPWVPEVQATLGQALWMNGEGERGIALMEKALKKLGESPESVKVRLRGFIAEAKAGLRN